jgi:hypothetical protein
MNKILLTELLLNTKQIRKPLDEWKVDYINGYKIPINYDLIKLTKNGIVKFNIYKEGKEWLLDDQIVDYTITL